jgi:hypothetical protein
MRKKVQYSRIDSDGFYLEPVLFDENVIPVDEDIVIVEVQEGLYRPRWDGTAWIEGLTPAELDAIVNAPEPPDPDEELAVAIQAATTLDELKTALLGNGKLARVKGKMK